MKRYLLAWLVVILSFGLMPATHALHQAGSEKEMEIQGRILCIDEEGAEVTCSESSDRFVLETEKGKRFYFSSRDPKTAMFEDPRVRDRELVIRVWPTEEEDTVEIIKVYSLVDGVLHDVHYFCSVCNITAYAGGPCWCCQQEFEFREVPVE